MESFWWLFIFIGLLLFELLTMGLTTIWFAGGALVALVAALLGASVKIQVTCFILVSLLLLIFTRPFLRRYLSFKKLNTNADGVIGRIGRVTIQVDNLQASGAVVVDGQEWTARSERDEETIPVGHLVKVKRIVGVKLIVETYLEEEKQHVDSGSIGQ